jgi:LacI family transcriptional regulator
LLGLAALAYCGGCGPGALGDETREREAAAVEDKEMAIVGINDFDWAEIMDPRPTTIAQPIVDVTRVAISKLLDHIRSGTKPEAVRRRFEPTPVVRASCGGPF